MRNFLEFGSDAAHAINLFQYGIDFQIIRTVLLDAHQQQFSIAGDGLHGLGQFVAHGAGCEELCYGFATSVTVVAWVVLGLVWGSCGLYFCHDFRSSATSTACIGVDLVQRALRRIGFYSVHGFASSAASALPFSCCLLLAFAHESGGHWMGNSVCFAHESCFCHGFSSSSATVCLSISGDGILLRFARRNGDWVFFLSSIRLV